MAAAFDVDLDDINPVFDLVTFNDVRDIMPTTKIVRATYNLGVDFRPHNSDWVGLFYTGWGSTQEYLAYRWAPKLPRSIKTRQRRNRTVKFSVIRNFDLNDKESSYQFLYVTCDGHVVGVSKSFTVRTRPGYEDDLCWDTLEHSVTSSPSFTFIWEEPRRKRSFEDTFEFINDTDDAMAAKKKRGVKERITIVSRDHDSLVNIPTTLNQDTMSDKLKVVKLYHAAKQYIENREKSVVPYTPALKPIYDVSTYRTNKSEVIIKDKERGIPLTKLEFLYLPFEQRLPIMPGPDSMIQILEESAGNCRACALGKNFLNEYRTRDEKSSQLIKNLEKEVKQLKEQVKESELRLQLQTATVACRLSKDNIQKLESIMSHNNGLEKKLSDLENKINVLLQEKKEREEERSETPDHAQLCSLLKEGYRGVLMFEGQRLKVMDAKSSESLPEEEAWTVRYPKKIDRLRKTIVRQNSTISSLRSKVTSQREVIDRRTREYCDVKSSVKVKDEHNSELKSRVFEMTNRIRAILRDRARDKTNEWRQFARKVHLDDKSTQSNESLVRKTSKKANAFRKGDIRSEPTLTCRKKRKASERVCPTCSLVFSPHVDPRVVEEHIVFHTQYMDTCRPNSDCFA